MKKMIFTAVAGIVLCAAVFTSYKVHANVTMSDRSVLLKQNLKALMQDLDHKPCESYHGKPEVILYMDCWEEYKPYIVTEYWDCKIGETVTSSCWVGTIEYVYNCYGALTQAPYSDGGQMGC